MTPPLRQLLEAIAGQPDAAGALVVSDEGLVIDAVLPPGVEPEAVAALATTAMRSLTALGDALPSGAPQHVVLESPHGVTILERFPNGSTVLVLAGDHGDVGQLLHDLRLQRPAIAELV